LAFSQGHVRLAAKSGCDPNRRGLPDILAIIEQDVPVEGHGIVKQGIFIDLRTRKRTSALLLIVLKHLP
jgi:hypothetical protein